MPVIQALRIWGRKDFKFKASLGYISCLKNKIVITFLKKDWEQDSISRTTKINTLINDKKKEFEGRSLFLRRSHSVLMREQQREKGRVTWPERQRWRWGHKPRNARIRSSRKELPWVLCREHGPENSLSLVPCLLKHRENKPPLLEASRLWFSARAAMGSEYTGQWDDW
jgi:hypothetical protein